MEPVGIAPWAKQIIALAKLKSTRAIETGIKSLLDTRTNTGWTTGGHTGVDVEVFAFGQGHESFYGQYDNTDIAKKIFSLLPDASQQTMTEEKATVKPTSAEGCDFEKDWRCQ